MAKAGLIDVVRDKAALYVPSWQILIVVRQRLRERAAGGNLLCDAVTLAVAPGA